MGLRDYLKERRTKANSEKRINKKAKRLFSPRKQKTSPLVKNAQNIADKGIQVTWRAYHETQNRKGEGKQIIMNQLKKVLVGDRSITAMTKNLIRDPTRPKNKTRVPPPSGIRTTKPRRRRRRRR